MKNNEDHNWNIPQRQANAGIIVIIYKAVITVIKGHLATVACGLFSGKEIKLLDPLEMMLIGIPAIYSYPFFD